MDELKQRIRDYIAAEEESLVSFLSDLIERKSVTGQEGEVASRVEVEMRRSGFDEVIVDSIGNIVGRVGSGPRVIVFDAHLDTVDVDIAQWDIDPFRAVIKDGRIYGRGACDDKGPFAALLLAGKAIKALGLEHDFTVYISGSICEEDCEGLALGSFLKEKKVNADCVVIAEASDLQIARGHRGRALVEAEFSGISVHASIHEKGDNPIEKALPFAAAVGELDKRLGEDPVLGKGDIVVTRIDCASVSMNTVPSSCKVIMDRRTNTLDTRESILKEIRSLPNADKAEIRFLQYKATSYNGYPIKAEEYFPAWVMAEDHPLIQGAVKAYSKMFGEDPVVTVWGFSSNGTYTMGQAGISTVGFGPGKAELAHKPNEYIDIKDLKEAACFYALLPWALSTEG